MVLLTMSLVLPAYADSDNETVVDLVNQAVEMFQAKGKDAAVTYANSTMGPLRKGALYAFAIDFKGQMLGHPVSGKLRGHDTLELQDAKGKFIVQEFMKIAKEQGQGWSEYWWLRATEAAPTLKKAYIKRVPNEDILVAAGYYVK
jgi:signal transduction histidine kinase